MDKKVTRIKSTRQDDLQHQVDELRISQGIKQGIDGWVRTICITSTTATFSFLLWLGSITYDKYPAFKAAIIAFIQTDKGSR